MANTLTPAKPPVQRIIVEEGSNTNTSTAVPVPVTKGPDTRTLYFIGAITLILVAIFAWSTIRHDSFKK